MESTDYSVAGNPQAGPDARSYPLAPGRRALLVFCGIVALGVVLGLGISVYRDHTSRVIVADVIAVVQSDIDKIEAFALREKRFPATSSEVDVTGNLPNTRVVSVLVSRRGILTVTFENPDASTLKGHSLVWVPQLRAGTVHWDCSGGTLPADYRPEACRAGIYSGEQSPATAKWASPGDGLARMLVPMHWDSLPASAGQDFLQYGSLEREHYLRVRSKSSQELGELAGLPGFFELLIASDYGPHIRNLGITFLGAIEVNGLQGLKYELRGQVNGSNRVHLAVVLQGASQFHELLFWAPADRWSETSALYETTLATFSECAPDCKP